MLVSCQRKARGDGPRTRVVLLFSTFRLLAKIILECMGSLAPRFSVYAPRWLSFEIDYVPNLRESSYTHTRAGVRLHEASVGWSLALSSNISCFLVCCLSCVVRLLFPKALGIDVQMPGGVGILVPHPLKDPADFEARIPKEVDVKDKLSHVIQAVVRIKEVRACDQQPSLKCVEFESAFSHSL